MLGLGLFNSQVSMTIQSLIMEGYSQHSGVGVANQCLNTTTSGRECLLNEY
jgi:hypothetical protein